MARKKEIESSMPGKTNEEKESENKPPTPKKINWNKFNYKCSICGEFFRLKASLIYHRCDNKIWQKRY